ncbi:G5 domain-containing protein [Bacillus sp. FJAT-45037]|uniref:G5 domain-containing protein n=1 Tax=Bacillus sp. FJAT-45037 TaxID=2011007 RepID=UPI000C24B4FD|nr:G5 domain-containing protein [Bacillus sp. FJAT-45037]
MTEEYSERPNSVKSFMLIGLSALGILVSSLLLSTLFNTFVIGEQTFDANTYVASINVEGLETSEAEQLIDEQITDWLMNPPVYLTYVDEHYALEASMYQFNVQSSVDQAQFGDVNALYVTVETVQLKDFVLEYFGENLVSFLDFESLQREIETRSQFLPNQEMIINLNDHFSDVSTSEVTVAQATMRGITITPEIEQTISQLYPLVVEAESLFSFQSVLLERELGSGDEDVLTILASTLHKAVIETNFDVLRRTISSEVPPSVEVGYEALINENTNYEFFNPNSDLYSIHFEAYDQAVSVSIIGREIPFQYEIEKVDERELEPRSVLQFSSKLSQGETTVIEDGKVGSAVTLNRKVISRDGTILETEELYSDFYRPIHRVVQRSLLDREQSQNEEVGIPGQPDQGENVDGDSLVPTDSDNGQDPTRGTGTDGDPTHNQGTENELTPGSNEGRRTPTSPNDQERSPSSDARTEEEPTSESELNRLPVKGEE